MKLSPEITQAVAKELAAEMKGGMEELRLLTLQQAADLLGVSKATVKALVGEVIDLGPQSLRVEHRRVKEIIDSRRVPV